MNRILVAVVFVFISTSLFSNSFVQYSKILSNAMSSNHAKALEDYRLEFLFLNSKKPNFNNIVVPVTYFGKSRYCFLTPEKSSKIIKIKIPCSTAKRVKAVRFSEYNSPYIVVQNINTKKWHYLHIKTGRIVNKKGYSDAWGFKNGRAWIVPHIFGKWINKRNKFI